MRFGLAIECGTTDGSLEESLRFGAEAEELGLDLAWIEPGGPHPAAPLALTAALAARTSVLRLVACVAAGPHPLSIAEEAAVTDQCANGRLVVAVGEQAGDEGLLEETVEVLLAAWAPRPFRHHGERWTIPAAAPDGEPGARIRVTPSPAQLELPLWLSGPAAGAVARRRALTHVVDAAWPSEQAAAEWAATEVACGSGAARLRRPAIRTLETDADGHFDDRALVTRLRAEQQTWGLDVAILAPPASLGAHARRAVLHRLTTLVRPRLQLDELPPGLEDFWDHTLRAPSGAANRPELEVRP